MNNVLVFFSIPLSTIILSAILETFINCPIKVGGIFFSIFIVAAAFLGTGVELLFAVTIYTIISLLTAFIVFILKRVRCNFCNSNNDTEDIINQSNILSEEYVQSRNCLQDCNIPDVVDSSNNMSINDLTQNKNYYNRKCR